ncbi:MAG: glycosyltransferase family 9 protein [Candidatus Caenarcaniphilales bacterium]|nr:glycosyltransferase family 9 protein [Candidatus Caenarcaniphilales bacterium]
MKPRHICVLRVGAIGDVIHTLPLVNLLSQSFKERKITYAMDESLIDVMQFARGIDQIFPITLNGNIFNLLEQGKKLKKSANGRFKTFINLQPNWKSKLISKVISPELYFEYSKSSNFDEHVWQNFAESYYDSKDLEDYAIDQFFPLIRIPNEIVSSSAFKYELDEEKKLIGLVPGVGKHRPHRAWPIKNWLQFFKMIEERNNYKAHIVLIGGKDEIQLCDELITHLPSYSKIRLTNLCGKSDLLETAAVLKRCDIAIGGDTGPIHLASAVGTEVICMFGPTSPSRHAPFTGLGIQASDDYECAKACTPKKCARKVLNCMESLSPEEVWLAMNEV